MAAEWRRQIGAPAAVLVAAAAVLLLLPSPALAQDKQCSAKLGRIQSCFLFVEGNTSEPGARCCRSLRYVYHHSPVCLCELLSSTGGIATMPGINVSNAVQLPVKCNVSSNTSACPALLEANGDQGSLVPITFTTLLTSLAASLLLW